MDYDQALQILGLPKEAQNDPQQIESAFQRLAARYPPDHFPIRFRELHQARTLMLGTSDFWKQCIQSDSTSLEWLAPYIKKTSPTNTDKPYQAPTTQELYCELMQNFLPVWLDSRNATRSDSPFDDDDDDDDWFDSN